MDEASLQTKYLGQTGDEEIGRCVLCHDFFLSANLREIELDVPGHWRLICLECQDARGL